METIKPEGDFTHSLWEAIQPVYNKLIDHSFVNKLADGTLTHTNFAHYLSQDVLYIRDDAKALKELSEKTAKSTEKSFFISLANDGIAIEQELHNHFLEHFKVIEAKEKSPVIKAYTDFLLEHSTKSSYGIAAAALLPCYWIYYVVGKHIVLNATKNNKYQKWIDTYQGDEFGYYTKNFIRIVERIAKTASSTEKEKMTDAFVTAGKFELNFFNEAIMK